MAYSTADIRNLALVGQSGAGKTALIERLLMRAGAVRNTAGAAKGAPICDFDPQEKQFGHSIDAAIVHCAVDGRHIHLIDTPGYADLQGRALTALEAVETAVIVVSAVHGIEPMTQRVAEFARQRGLCTLFVINKIDARDAHPERVLSELRDMFGRECLPLNLPAADSSAVLDCFFAPSDRDPQFSTIAQAHTEIVDQVVEVDEDLMAKYLEQGAMLAPEQLHDAFEQALREGHLMPVCFVSAETGAGVAELLSIVARLMPSPLEGNPPPFLRGVGEQAQRVSVQPDPTQHVIAHVFKIAIDPFVGRMGIFRVHQGTVRNGMQLFVGDARKPVRITHLYRLQGKEHTEIPQAIPGDICAVSKLDDLHFDAVLHDSHDADHYHLKSIALPPAMSGIAIEPERRGEEQKLSDALHKLLAEDQSVRIEHHPGLNETVLYGMGELHLRVLLGRMSERYGVRCKTHPPSIPYRETITRPGDAQYRHKKQTGGAGQFAAVHLRVEPLPRGRGFEFEDEVVGGAIPGQFIPAIEKGVRQVLDEGVLAGYPVQDVRVVVYDGKHHPVDSKEIAFVTAGRRALQHALRDAQPIVLEPVMRVDAIAPASATGDITGDLATRRGRISGSQMLSGQRTRIQALVPLAEVNDYATRIKALTGGEGMFTMELSHYEPVPPRKQEELASSYRRIEED